MLLDTVPYLITKLISPRPQGKQKIANDNFTPNENLCTDISCMKNPVYFMVQMWHGKSWFENLEFSLWGPLSNGHNVLRGLHFGRRQICAKREIHALVKYSHRLRKSHQISTLFALSARIAVSACNRCPWWSVTITSLRQQQCQVLPLWRQWYTIGYCYTISMSGHLRSYEMRIC